MLVSLPDNKGIGKLEAAADGVGTVSVFYSILRTETYRIPLKSLRRAYLSPQTRVYVRDDDRFRVGRVKDYLTNDGGPVSYEVKFPNGRRSDYSEVSLFLRPWFAFDDPAEVLAAGGAESQYLHDRRHAAVVPLLRLRGVAQGLTALTSVGIEMAAHQVAAVRRVLTDPVQRYLLADEVGLGKTIEAGLIVRQHLIDNPASKVTVVVPAHLCTQWRRELAGKLRLNQFPGAVDVIAHEEFVSVDGKQDILVVDEAHHLVGLKAGPLAAAATRLRQLASDCSVLLLLSATPVLGDESRFLALLNLLDPQSHPLDDVEAFRQKLQGRRDIGRLLLGLDAEAPGLVLRQRAAEMQRRFPDDATVAELAPKLGAATREAPGDLPALCKALKFHIADTYRIHQRLIRSRRVDAENWAFASRGQWDKNRPLFTHVRVESDASGWAEPMLPILDEWRLGAIEAIEFDAGRLKVAARRYRDLLGAAAEGRQSLVRWIEIVQSQPLFGDEASILARLMQHISDVGAEEDYATACESTRRLILSLRTENRSPKIVAFSSTPSGAISFHAALIAALSEVELFLIAGDGAEADEVTVAAFVECNTAAVLICDQHGEEGLNLTCADAIVHLDLPMSAARVEQRIGRLDRFGRRQTVVRHRVMVPVEEDDSPWTGWNEFLQRGLCLFHRSISDIQFLIDDLEQRAFVALLQEGPSGIAALCSEVREVIEEERRSQDEQYALDRIALAEEPVETFIRELEAAEEDESALQEGVDKWLVNTLQLNKDFVAWPERDPFKLRSDANTLIPRLPWLQAFRLDTAPLFTWRRRVAAACPESVLLRPGTPLLDLAERFTRWDDRGSAFVTWRTVPNWEGDLWLGFRLCFVVEPDVPMSDMLEPSRTDLALCRRAQGYLAPRLITVHVNSDGSLLEDATLLSILAKPYFSTDGAKAIAGDVNLGSRPNVLASVIDVSSFASLCRAVRDSCRSRLLLQDTLRSAIEAGVQRALADIERHRLRLRRSESEGIQNAQDAARVLETLLPAIAKPALKLDAMGCFVVSSVPPGADAHA